MISHTAQFVYFIFVVKNQVGVCVFVSRIIKKTPEMKRKREEKTVQSDKSQPKGFVERIFVKKDFNCIQELLQRIDSSGDVIHLREAEDVFFRFFIQDNLRHKEKDSSKFRLSKEGTEKKNHEIQFNAWLCEQYDTFVDILVEKCTLGSEDSTSLFLQFACRFMLLEFSFRFEFRPDMIEEDSVEKTKDSERFFYRLCEILSSGVLGKLMKSLIFSSKDQKSRKSRARIINLLKKEFFDQYKDVKVVMFRLLTNMVKDGETEGKMISLPHLLAIVDNCYVCDSEEEFFFTYSRLSEYRPFRDNSDRESGAPGKKKRKTEKSLDNHVDDVRFREQTLQRSCTTKDFSRIHFEEFWIQFLLLISRRQENQNQQEKEKEKEKEEKLSKTQDVETFQLLHIVLTRMSDHESEGSLPPFLLNLQTPKLLSDWLLSFLSSSTSSHSLKIKALQVLYFMMTSFELSYNSYFHHLYELLGEPEYRTDSEFRSLVLKSFALPELEDEISGDELEQKKKKSKKKKRRRKIASAAYIPQQFFCAVAKRLARLALRESRSVQFVLWALRTVHEIVSRNKMVRSIFVERLQDYKRKVQHLALFPPQPKKPKKKKKIRDGPLLLSEKVTEEEEEEEEIEEEVIVTGEKQECDVLRGLDPFVEDAGLDECKADESCLWELKSLESHVLPQIGELAKTVNRVLENTFEPPHEAMFGAGAGRRKNVDRRRIGGVTVRGERQVFGFVEKEKEKRVHPPPLNYDSEKTFFF